MRTRNSIRGFVCPSVRPSVDPSRSSWKVGKRAFPPLPTRPQLVAVYPALLYLHSRITMLLFFLGTLGALRSSITPKPQREQMQTNEQFQLSDLCSATYAKLYSIQIRIITFVRHSFLVGRRVLAFGLSVCWWRCGMGYLCGCGAVELWWLCKRWSIALRD